MIRRDPSKRISSKEVKEQLQRAETDLDLGSVHVTPISSFKWVPIILDKILHARCASFHPIDPILACGLYDGRVLFLRESEQSRSMSDWKSDENDALRIGGFIVSIEWNVRTASMEFSDFH